MIFPIFALAFLFLLPVPVMAVCPVCTVAVGAGVGLSRWLGIDDTVTGIWIGGLIVSSSLWLTSWLKKRGVCLPGGSSIPLLAFYLLVLLPLYFSSLIGHVLNTLWGVDKLVLGTIIGSLIFTVSVWLDGYLRSRNGDKVYFYYQKVILPILFLLIFSLIFYFLTK